MGKKEKNIIFIVMFRKIKDLDVWIKPLTPPDPEREGTTVLIYKPR